MFRNKANFPPAANIAGKALACVLVVATLTSVRLLGQGTPAKLAQPLANLCLEDRYLEVSVSSPARDTIPKIQALLTDNRGRTQGFGAAGVRIPRSSYRELIELPNVPQHSKAHAIELCRAEYGTYKVTIYEHSSEQYRLTVTGSDGKRVADSAIQHLLASEGRSRQYEFVFKVVDGKAAIAWLDSEGNPQRRIGYNDW